MKNLNSNDFLSNCIVMSAYDGPREILPIFNESDFTQSDATDSNALALASAANINSKYEMHTGLLTGGVVTINALDDKKIDITGGIAIIVDYTTPTSISTKTITWNAQTAIAPSVTGFAVWIAVYDNAGTTDFFYTTDPTPLDRRSKAFISRIWSTLGDTSLGITNQARYSQPAYALAQSFQDFTLGISSLNLTGNIFSAGTLLKVNKSAGKSYRYWTDANNLGYESTHIDSALTNISTYNYHLQSSTVTTTKTGIDFENWDNAGVSTAVTTGYWTVQEIWYYPVSQVIAVIYGQAQYSNLPAAFIGLTVDKVRNTGLLQGAIFRAYVIGQKGMSDLANAFFIEQSTINQPMMTSGQKYENITKSFSFADPGSEDMSYVGGFYEASATDFLLPAGGIQIPFGAANLAYGAYAFAVAAGPANGVSSLIVTGTSISEFGVRTINDSEVLVADASTAIANEYFQTTKRWIGQIVYSLVGAGQFRINYGIAAYEHMNDRDFYVTSFDLTGKSNANGNSFDVTLLHHRFTGWTYSAAAFVPGSSTGTICSMLGDYVNSSIATGEYFSYMRNGLFYKIEGSRDRGVLIKITQTTNNAFKYMTCSIGMIL